MERTEMERIYKQYADMIYRIALNDTHSPTDAEDILQEVLIARFLHSGFEDPEYEKRWLIRVTLNKGKNLRRTLLRRSALPLESIYEQPAPDRPDYRPLRAAVAALPRKLRNAIDLYYFEGYSTAEIAGLLSANEATVRTWLRRGRMKLKEILQEEWNDDEF